MTDMTRKCNATVDTQPGRTSAPPGRGIESNTRSGPSAFQRSVGPARRASRGRGLFRRLLLAAGLVLGLVAGASAEAGLSVSPNPSSDGAYTVTWTAIPAASAYQLHEGATLVYKGAARTKAFSGKAAGSYTYTLTYCLTVPFPSPTTTCNLPSSFTAVTVTVSGGTIDPPPPPAPAAPTLSVPASSTTGNYTVSWSKPSGATTYELQQKVGSAAFKRAYAGKARSKAYANEGSGAYSYRVRACAGASNCGKWSATKNVRVTRTTSTISAKPTLAPGGNYTVSWTKSALSSGYKLLESFNNGASTKSYSVNGLMKTFANPTPGSYTYSLQTCFDLFGAVTCVPASGSVTVTVPVPPTGTISAEPSPCILAAGKTRCSTTVTWSTANAASPCVFVEASKGKFACARMGSKTATRIGTAGSTFLLKAGNTFEAATLASVTVKAVPAPKPTVDASFDRAQIDVDDNVTLTWESTDATSCSGSRPIGSAKSSGMKTYTPTAVGKFSVTVTCTGLGGSASDTATVDVEEPDPPAGVPAAPATPAVTTESATGIEVTWTAPVDNGAAITDFDVQYRKSTETGWDNHAFSGTGTSTTVGGLDPNTTYEARVRAENSVGESTWSKPGSGKTDDEAPSAPAAPTVSATGSTSLNATWTKPANRGSAITDYDVRYRLNRQNAAWKNHAFAGTGTATAIGGLASDATYAVQVRAENGKGESPWSSSGTGTTPKPPAPATFTVPASDADGRFTVSWSASAGAMRYELEESIRGQRTELIEVETTSAAVTGRRIVAYGYRVRGCARAAAASCGAWTSVKTVTVTGAIVADPNPSPDGAYTVRWTPALVATGYILEESADGGATWPGSYRTLPNAAERSFSEKSAGTYTYRVRKCTVSGGGIVPVVSCAKLLIPTTLEVEVSEPLAAPTLTASADAAPGGAFTVRWTASPDATGYVLQERVDGGSFSDVDGVTGRSHGFKGRGIAVYGYRVKACDDDGECGSWSAEATVRVPPPVPTGLTVPASDADGDYSVTWTASAGADRHVLEENDGGATWRAVARETTDTNTSRAISKSAGGTYAYRVKACKGAANCSVPGTAKSVTVLLDAGSAGIATPAVSDGDYTVTWPELFSGANVLKPAYALLERAAGATAWTAYATGSNRTKSFADKPVGVYTYDARACITVTLFGRPRTVCVTGHDHYGWDYGTTRVPPAAPAGLAATAPDAQGKFKVSWNASTGADRYRLQEEGDDEVWTDIPKQASDAARSRTVTRAAGVHTFRALACAGANNCGEAGASLDVTVRPAAPVITPGSCSEGSYALTWTEVPGAETYELQQKTGSEAWGPAYAGDDAEASLKLVAGTDYDFQAKACAEDDNCGAWSATLTVTAPECGPPPPPPAPENLRLEATGPNDVTVRWDAVDGSDIRYELQQKGAGDWGDAYSGGAIETAFALKDSGDYAYQVRACPKVGDCGDYSDSVAVTVPVPPPAPENLAVSEPAADASFSVSWTNVAWGTGTVTYELKETHGAEVTVAAVAASPRAVSGKAPGEYSFTVRSCAPATNCGAWSAPVSVTAPPRAPAVDRLACKDGRHRVTWSAVTGAINYALQQKTGLGKWEPAYDGAETFASLTLAAGTGYAFQAKACAEDDNCGAWSATLTVTAPDCTKPGVPGGLAVRPSGPGSYTVDWDPVAGDTLRYELEEKGAGDWENVHDGALTDKAFTAKTDGTYTYRVRACPAMGDCGDYSASVAVTVPIPPPAPSNLAATTPDGDFTVSWDAVAWGNGVTYALEERPDGGAWTEIHNGGAVTASVAGKSNGAYGYRVRTCARGVCGDWSAPLTVTVTASVAASVETPPAPFAATASLVSAAETTATDKAGTLAGAFRVTESGAASYRVPIYAVPGTAGVTPELALAYNSQGGNGIAGLGWTLEGASSIVRCRATRHQDGVSRPVQWNAHDRFCLDGQRLVLESGTYGSPGSTYRTEIDSYAAVKAVGGTAGHPDRFEVRRKDGSVSHYGNAPGGPFTDARRKGGNGKVFAWALKRFADSVGNPVWYVYAGGADSHRLVEVRYAYGSQRKTTDHHAKIEFVYEDRADDITGYVAGHRFANRKRLRAVRTHSQVGTALEVLRELRLGYRSTARAVDRTSRLVSMTECVGTAVTDACLPATTFAWPSRTVGFRAAASGSVDLTRRKDRGVLAHHPADIDGDGAMDLVWVEWDVDGGNDTDHHIKYALSDGTMLNSALFDTGAASIEHKENVGKTVANVLARPIDYNGDGRSDVAVWRSRDAVWRVHLSVPVASGGWRLAAAPVATPVTDRFAEFTDLNGDGLVDAVSARGATIYARYLERRDALTETDPIPPNQAYAFGDETVVHTVAPGPFGELTLNPSTGIWAGNYDFNGDGRADIVARTRFAVVEGGPIASIAVTRHGPYVATADGTWKLYANFGVDTLHPADFNGDGLTDLVRVTRNGSYLIPYLEINTGTGFADTYTGLLLNADEVRILAPFDVNGDGRADFVWHDRRTKRILTRLFDPNTGALETAATRTVRARNVGGKDAHLFLDANGDGATDYLQLSDTSSKGKLETFLSNDTGKFPNQVSSIENGLGAVTTIAHESLSRTDHYERLDVRRTVVPTQFCFGFLSGAPCVPYANPIDSDLELTDENGNLLPLAERTAKLKAKLDERIKAFYAALNAGWTLPAGAQTLGTVGPVLEFTGPVPVVTRIDSSAPRAGAAPGAVASAATSAVEYYYADAKVQAMGRGLLGFGQLRTVDQQTDVETTTAYRHDFPFTGLPVATEVVLPVTSGTKTVRRRLSASNTTWKLTGYQDTWAATAKASGTAALGAFQPYAAQVIEKTYDLNGGTDDKPTLLTTVTTTSAFDEYGNATNVTVATAGGGRVFETATVNKYGPADADKKLGRLTETAVTHSRRAAADDPTTAKSVVRKSAFNYFGQAACPVRSAAHAGLLCQEIVEPDRETLKVTTTHTYDAFGNRIRAKVDYFDDTPVPGGASVTGNARIKTRCNVDTAAYDPRGRFVKTRSDCLGRRVSEVTSRNAYGAPTAVKRYLDGSRSRHVTETIAYTPGGVEVFRGSDTGAHALTTRAVGAPTGKPKDDPAECPAGTAFHERVRGGGGGETVTCFDALARETRTASRGFDGAWVHTDTEYDSLGRVRRVSEPYYDEEDASCGTMAGQTKCWTTTGHDILGRITSSTGPDGSVTRLGHAGFSTTATNALGQMSTTTANALGETVGTRDHAGGTVTFGHDPQGNVVTATRTKPASDTSQAPASVVTSMTYDIAGRKTATRDPDTGISSVAYNALGEARCTRDGAGHLTVTAYDGLGRPVSRRDYRAHASVNCATLTRARDSALEANAVWTYDAPNGLGRPASVTDSESGYRRTFTYDTLGRPATAVTVPGTGAVEHYEKTTYDQYGRVFQVFDASRTEATFTDNGVRHVYNANGYPEKLQDAAGTVDGQGTFTPQVVYRTVTATDARGNVTAETLGNGVKRAHRHDGKTGRVLGILSTRAATGDRQNLTYAWDVLGNLKSRKRGSGPSALTETFGYDTLNRLETYRAGTRAAQSVTYDGYGNIRTKSGVGAYVYGADGNAPMGTTAGPHAVATVKKSDNTEVTYAYDDNGNNVSSSDGRTIAWATFDKPTSIAKGGHTTAFAYAPDRSRFRRIDSNAQGDTTTLYLGGVEKITHPNKTTEIKRYIGGVVIETEGPAIGSCPADATRYVLRDHLGSVDVLTDAVGNEVKSLSFDPWGRGRDPDDWSALTDMEVMTVDRCDTRRGFTNHEMLDAVGVVHMNGRIYDPTLARFLQADPFVQFPTNLQSHNRYSYVMNNPLAYTDPSGHIAFSLAATVFLAKTSLDIGLVTAIATLSAAGFADALVQGASFGQALQAGFLSGISAAAFSGIGGYLGSNFSGTFAAGLSPGGFALKVLFHGTVGGITSVLGGGRFGHGFASGGVTALGTSLNNSRHIGRLGFSPLRVAIGSAIGGTASRLTGGKFANGAVTGAFSQAFNNEMSEVRFKSTVDRVIAALQEEYGDILEAGKIDLERNIRDARKMSMSEFIARLRPESDWDYKTSPALKASNIDALRLAEFGNLHYGIVAAARGYTLPLTLSAAGAVQTLFQEGGSFWQLILPYLAQPVPPGLHPAGVDFEGNPMLSREAAIRWIESGGTFGDMPDDPPTIERGWNLYHGR